ncbi:MAG: DUF2200 domain-containing protein [Pseudomonadota bacterium]
MKKPPAGTEARVAKMSFGSIYPLYLSKIEKKGRTKEELHRVITWLTGYDDEAIEAQVSNGATFETFFAGATLHSNVHLIKGVICGYRVEEMDEGLLKQSRYLDKLIDELARGKKIESILRKEK